MKILETLASRSSEHIHTQILDPNTVLYQRKPDRWQMADEGSQQGRCSRSVWHLDVPGTKEGQRQQWEEDKGTSLMGLPVPK